MNQVGKALGVGTSRSGVDWSALARATSSDDSPIPGYLFVEITRMTQTSFDACKEVENYLINRIQKNNHNIKYKCLLLIKELSIKGRPDFKQDMLRMAEPIRDCLQFTGPPDQLRGDEIYRRVRELAKETLEIMSTSELHLNNSIISSDRLQGFGNHLDPPNDRGDKLDRLSTKTKVFYNDMKDKLSSNDMKYIGGNESKAGSLMVGIGNPNFEPQRNDNSWVDKAKSLAEIAGTKIRSLKSNQDPLWKPDASYYTNRGEFGTTSQNYDPTEITKSYERAKTATSFDWVAKKDGNETSVPSVGGVWANASTPVPSVEKRQPENFNIQDEKRNLPPSYDTLRVGRTGGAEEGEYERKLIAELCGPGGARAVPPKDKLIEFLHQARSLNPRLIGDALLDCLTADQWQLKCKALCVIEALVKSDTKVYEHFFLDNAEEIQLLLHDSKVAVRDKTIKVLTLLKVDTLGVTQSQGTEINNEFHQENDQPEESQINRHLQSQLSVPQQPSVQQPPMQQPQEIDLLGGFEPSLPKTQNNLNESNILSNFQTLNNELKTNPQVENHVETDLFSNLLTKDTQIPKSVPQTIQKENQNNQEIDLLSLDFSQTNINNFESQNMIPNFTQNVDESSSYQSFSFIHKEPEQPIQLVKPVAPQALKFQAVSDPFAGLSTPTTTNVDVKSSPKVQSTQSKNIDPFEALKLQNVTSTNNFQSNSSGLNYGTQTKPTSDPNDLNLQTPISIQQLAYQNMLLQQQIQASQVQMAALMQAQQQQQNLFGKGMLLPTAPRAVIPDLSNPSSNSVSGFGFISNDRSANRMSVQSQNDSFSFVRDAMKTANQK